MSRVEDAIDSRARLYVVREVHDDESPVWTALEQVAETEMFTDAEIMRWIEAYGDPKEEYMLINGTFELITLKPQVGFTLDRKPA
jgi:hypothetical protein